MKPIAVGVALAALVILSGCATKPIPYDRTAAQENKTIGLLTPGWPSGPASVLASNVGQSFGLVGALVNAAMQANRDKELSGILTTQQVNANALFVASLTAELQKEGYTVLPVSADQTRGNFLKKYPLGGEPRVDSYLDVVTLGYGYMASGTGDSTPYRPAVAARVKLVKASDGSVLMQDQVAYNPIAIGQTQNTVTLSPDPAFAFVSWSDVTADPQKAAAGVTGAVDQSARAVGDLLK
jgi:hypothetical protein